MPKDRASVALPVTDAQVWGGSSAPRLDPPLAPQPHFRGLLRTLDTDSVVSAMNHRERLRGKMMIKTLGLAGRVIRHPKDAPCPCWDLSKSRRIVFFLDDAAFTQCLDAANDRAFLMALGYPASFIEAEMAAGNVFEFVFFEAATSSLADIQPATWDNLTSLAAKAYGEAVADRIRHVLPELKTTRSFEEFETVAGMTIDSAKRVDAACHVTARQLAAIPIDQVEAWQVRFFLALACNVNPLFSGDGWTRGENGERGIPELIGLNGPIADAGVCHRIPLNP